MKKQLNLIILLFIAINICAEIPAGYYNKADGKSGFDLLNSLNEICSNGYFLGYGSGEGYTWEGFYYTDRNDDGSIRDMYSSTIRYQSDFGSVEGLHIEHSLPKSWWGALENYAYRDLHHLFPADATTNITKNNLPLGEVVKATFDNGVSKIGTTTLYQGQQKCFEPNDEYKGDFARAYLYISTTYNEFSTLWQSPMMNNNTYPVWNDEALNLLLKWHRNDPVSEKELKRQEAVYQIQHNRNPYIDYPEMVEHIWGNLKDKALNLPDETRPFLTSPNSWEKIECDVAFIGVTTTKKIHFEGANFTNNIQLKLANQSSEISLSTTYITPTNIKQGYDLTISINSNEIKNVIDTLIICTTDTLKLPISATFTDEFMITSVELVNPVTANIEWTKISNAKSYEVTLRNAPQNRTTDLMFSAYVEGSSYNKAISIYNGTGKTIDLKYYSLRKQSNGIGALKLDYPLSDSLNHGDCYVIVSSRADDALQKIADHIVKSPLNEDNLLNFNGNDVVALYHNGILIDMLGELNNSADWGKDISLERKNNILAPNAEFNWNEWTKYKQDDFSHLQQHVAQLNSSSKVIEKYTSTNNYITIDNLTPNTTYFAEVKCDNKMAVNLIAFTTTQIVAPEAYEATDIYATQFTANWEQISYAKGYIVELMQMADIKEVIVEENFDNVGSNGKPLPEGWSGSASGNYTTEASSGKSVPSIGLKNKGEYIQTPTTSEPITYFEFMYRFPSAASGSYFIIYTIDQQGNLTELDRIEYANSTKKVTLQYADLNNTYAVRIEYHKSSGNLAIDDFIYKYGKSTSNVIASEYTTKNWFIFDNLTANTTYYYQVKCVINDNYTTTASNIVKVNTNNIPVPPITGTINETSPIDYKYYIANNTLFLEGLTSDCEVNIYNIQGAKIYNCSQSSKMIIPISQKGIYISQIKNNNQITTFKFIIK